jgi:Cu(I)/Ag(I) efflux system membrane fusion protein
MRIDLRNRRRPDSNVRTGRTWVAVLTIVVLLLLGSGLWIGGMYYGRSTMNMPAANEPQPASREHSTGEAVMPGMSGMNGMDMGGAAAEDGQQAASALAGYAEVTVPSNVQGRIGVTVGEVEQAPLTMSIRTVGIVQENETRVQHVHLKTEGWIEKLYVNYTGQKVAKGDPLLSIYSPDFLSAQAEYLVARQSPNRGPVAGLPSLVDSARVKMQLWDVPDDEIQELERTGVPQKDLVMRSKIDGTVTMKNAFEGQRVMPEQDLFIVADLSTVWIQSKVYEYDLPHVELGQPAAIHVPAMPEQEFTGKVDFIGPVLDETTRTAPVRVELPNPDGAFKPGMFVDVEIQHRMGEGLLIPDSAVIRTGKQDISFRVEPDNRFVPVEVKLGTVKFGDRFQVLNGLAAGDKVVTSANFLIDSESRLRGGGGGGMAGMPGMDMGEPAGKSNKDGAVKGMDDSKTKGMDGPKQKDSGASKMDGMEGMKM